MKVEARRINTKVNFAELILYIIDTLTRFQECTLLCHSTLDTRHAVRTILITDQDQSTIDYRLLLPSIDAEAAGARAETVEVCGPIDTMVKGSVETDVGWTPIYLATLAGMSTCLGALIVFCHPIEDDDGADNDDDVGDLDNSQQHRLIRSGKRKVSPSTMAFSLALAGSVMVTVSVVSIGPECLAASSMSDRSHKSDVDIDSENSFFIFGITLMPILSWAFLQRLLSFAAGSFAYFLLSKYAFPEPEEILSHHFELHPLSVSRKGSDDGHVNNLIKTKQSPSNESIKSMESNPIGKLSGNLQRRGTFTEDAELTTKNVIDGGGKKRAALDQNPFTSCISSLRIFMRGSDLTTSDARRANRVAMLLFFSLLLHNFPEGLAVAASALESDQLGMTVAIGIMIHNIPEGIAIAIPCLKARPDSPWLCFILASVSGLAEPLGALMSLTLLKGIERRQASVVGDVEVEGEIEGEGSLENVLAFVAGIMIAVSVLELLPEAKRHTEQSGMKPYYAGLVVGFIVMIGTELGMSL